MAPAPAARARRPPHAGRALAPAAQQAGPTSIHDGTRPREAWAYHGTTWGVADACLGNWGTQVFTQTRPAFGESSVAALLSVHDGEPPLPIVDGDHYGDEQSRHDAFCNDPGCYRQPAARFRHQAGAEDGPEDRQCEGRSEQGICHVECQLQGILPTNPR